MMGNQHITFEVNRERCSASVEPRTLLVDFLRGDLGFTGTHVGCEQGVCGACTVLIDGKPARSCLLFAVQMDHRSIETIEGLAKNAQDLHPVQRALWECHGLQCGFCTPGMVITVKAFLEENPTPSEKEIREAIAGNICRCTGYEFIVEAVKAAASMMSGKSAGGS